MYTTANNKFDICRIPKEVFTKISQQITEVFPTESSATYYIPPYRDSKGKSVSAHGKLWDRYANMRKKYRELQMIPQKTKRTSKTADEGIKTIIVFINFKYTNLIETSFFVFVVEDSNADNEERLQEISWLKNNCQPWPAVVESWSATSKLRLEIYKRDETSIHAYYQMYPALRMPLGYTLVKLFYKELHLH